MSPPARRQRHVWVDQAGGTHPGVVVAWRKLADGWESQVAVVQAGSLLVTWVPATALRPVNDDRWQPGTGPT